jgi:hypothetical protein
VADSGRKIAANALDVQRSAAVEARPSRVIDIWHNILIYEKIAWREAGRSHYGYAGWSASRVDGFPGKATRGKIIVFGKVLKGKGVSAPPSRGVAERGVNARPWRAVSISGGTCACQASREVTHARYLGRDAPALPLAGCDGRACSCHYKHHDDRRDCNRRTPAYMSTLETWRTEERRQNRGRRREDK